MTTNEIKEICIKKGITFIPHHDCALCGVYVGWRIYGPDDVFFDPSCGCGCSMPHRETWDDVAKWVLKRNGTPHDEYEEILKDIAVATPKKEPSD